MENTNGDANQWETKDYGGYKVRPKCVRYKAHPTNSANDWFFTPSLSLTSGIQYTLRFKYRVTSATNPEKLAVWLGTAPASGSMTTQVFNRTNITDTLYRDTAVTFTVGSSGTYYIGFRCFSDANQKRLYIDDIFILMPEPNLELQLVMVKRIYQPTGTLSYPADPSDSIIECYVYLKNVGSSPITMNKQFATERDLIFIIISPTGDTLPFNAVIEALSDPSSEDIETLLPGKATGKFIDLRPYYRFEQTGTYSIRARYKNLSKVGGWDVWLGQLLSNQVDILIR